MDEARRIVRLFFTCPEADCNDYNSFPPLDEMDFIGMYSEYSLHSSEICLFIFVRESNSYGPFVDLYIWDAANIDGYERFIVCDGRQLSELKEEKLIGYIRNSDIYIDAKEFHEANIKIAEVFPRWHYKDYRKKYLSLALQHMYYASHSCGPKEILFKAEGLEFIAANIDKLPSYNILGTTPSSIIDKDIPLKLLRILDREALFDMLCEQSNRELCKAAYREYSGFIGKALPSVGQWNYILELYKNGGVFGGYQFKQEIYDRASNFIYRDEIEAYEKFFSIRKELNIPGKLVIPDLEEIWSALDHMEDLVRYKSESRIDNKIAMRKAAEYRYEYSNNEYEIVMPSCAFDICMESIYQRNCVEEYIADHADGETTILFLRKTKAPYVPFVTIEVGLDDDIQQVYGKCNSLPQKAVYQFIVEYCKARQFSCDMKKLIIRNISKIDESNIFRRDELMEFALDVHHSIKQISMEKDFVDYAKEYHQISMEEYFPEVYGENK